MYHWLTIHNGLRIIHGVSAVYVQHSYNSSQSLWSTYKWYNPSSLKSDEEWNHLQTGYMLMFTGNYNNAQAHANTLTTFQLIHWREYYNYLCHRQWAVWPWLVISIGKSNSLSVDGLLVTAVDINVIVGNWQKAVSRRSPNYQPVALGGLPSHKHWTLPTF